MILAIDTSQMTYSVATDTWQESWNDVNITLYDQLSHQDLSSVTTVLINIGPGRFSGLRSGLSFAKGFCQAKKIPLIGINRFELMRSMISESEFSMALDARKGQAFLQHSHEDTIQIIDQAKLSKIPNLYGNLDACQILETDASSLLDYYRAHKPEPKDPIEPLYIRESV